MYPHIFFDLDRTLWDFDRNSSDTIKELFFEQNVGQDLSIDFTTFLQSFKELNAISWRDYKRGKQSKEELRDNRFVETYFKFGSGDWKKARLLSKQYLQRCPQKPHLITGAMDMLKFVKKNHKIHIITNGFSDSQRLKLKYSGLKPHIDTLIISEETNYSKPDKGIFFHALKKTSAKAGEALMVGDDYKKDILGAMKAGWHQAHFNPGKTLVDGKKPTYNLTSLTDLVSILDQG